MPIYTVEIDGKQYDIEGDRPPSEAEARSAVGAYQPQATPPPEGAAAGMLPQSTAEGDPAEETVFGRPARPDLAMALNSEDVMGAPLVPPQVRAGAALAGKVPGILARTVAKHPTSAGMAIGAAPGIMDGNLEKAAWGAGAGFLGSPLLGRRAASLAKRLPGGSPQRPTATPMPTAAPATPADALSREVMARQPVGPINWRTTDAVPIDAMKRDVSRGGAIIEAGESQLGLGERIATLLKKGTPEAMAEATQLAKALRQRGHVRMERAGS